MTGLPYIRSLKSKCIWDGSYPSISIEEISGVCNDLDVLLPEDKKNEIIFSVDKDSISRKISELNDVEVGWFKLLRELEVVKNTSLSTDDFVNSGEVVSGVLRKKILSRINFSGAFVVFYRYLVDNSIDSFKNGKKCFFENIFNMIGATSIYGSSVDIITEKSNNYSVDEFINHLENCKNSKIKSVNVYFLRNNGMKQEGHHRYIRVGKDVIGFDSGLGIFCGDRVNKDSVCWYKSYKESGDVIKNEISLRNNSISHHQL